MRALFDASALIPLGVPEVFTVPAEAAWQDASERYCLDFTFVEVANALWRKQRRGDVPAHQPARVMSAMVSWVDTVLAARDHLGEALRLSAQLDHPVYDCLYGAAALQSGLVLVTADTTLVTKLRPLGCDVRLLAAAPV